MPDFVRIRAENGYNVTVSKEHAEANGLEPLDPEKYPAVDNNGRPLAEEKDASDEFDVDSASKAELEAEIARRNEGRADGALIVPASPNKPELVAALKADSQEENR